MTAEPEPHDQAAELAFVRAVLAGSESAIVRFNELLECLPRMLARLNAKLRPPLGEHDLRDVQQDVAMLLWRKLPKFAGHCPLAGWVHRTCRLELYNAVRRRFRLGKLFTSGDEAFLPAPTADTDDTRCDVTGEELLAAIERVGGAEADIIVLKHFEKLTFEEIGRRLHISPNTVKTRYYRGLDRVKRIFESRHGGEGT